jgi:hypothetical protein
VVTTSQRAGVSPHLPWVDGQADSATQCFHRYLIIPRRSYM